MDIAKHYDTASTPVSFPKKCVTPSRWPRVSHGSCIRRFGHLCRLKLGAAFTERTADFPSRPLPHPPPDFRMKTPRIILGLLFASLAVAAQATIGLGLQALLGNPSGATADPNNHTHYLIERPQYSLDYNDTTRQANWVSWNLTSTDVGGSGRSDDFFVDTSLPVGFYQVLTTDYSGSGYDRGHMCPSADRTITRADNDVTFFMSNMVPQTPDNNRGVWANFETYCRTLASAGNEVLIISGTSGFAGSTIASGVAIPAHTWKIVVVVPLGPGTAIDRIVAAGASAIRVIAIKVPNIAGINSTPWENFVTSPAQIQSDTGNTFFIALPAAIAADFRNRIDGHTSAGAPAIVVQPVPQSAPVGGNATFSVSASGNAPLSYQWFHGDDEVPGATADTLSLTGVGAADVGTYYVEVTNDVGVTTSASVALIVTGLPPTVATEPVSRDVAAGSTVSFTVVAGGTAPFTYQWRKGGVDLANGGNVSGAHAPTLTLTNVQAADIGGYSVLVSNNVSSVPSGSATLNVQAAAPTITSQPANRSLAPGSTATFSVVAVGSAPLTYQWFKDASVIDPVANPSAATATLVLTGISLADAGNYSVMVGNGIGSPAISVSASLSISSADAGAIYYTGGTYVQDFNTLPSTGSSIAIPAPATQGTIVPLSGAPINASGLGGWALSKYAGGTSAPTFFINAGTGTGGGVYSYGVAGVNPVTDRALGSLGSGSNASRFGATIVNNTGQTITSFKLGYTGEQWRRGSAAANELAFAYAINPTDLNTGGYTDVAALNFTAPVTAGSGVQLDGNSGVNRVVIVPQAVTLAVNWGPGDKLVIRWSDEDNSGSDDGISIDDLSFSTTITGPSGPSVQSTNPADGATDLALNTAIAITFDQGVNASGGAFTINSASRGVIAATLSVSADKRVYTFTPPTNFDFSDTISVQVSAAGVTSASTGLHPAADHGFQFVTAAPVPPGITAQPADQLNIPAGNTATFSVATTGTAPFTYQWLKDGLAISGNPTAATATLVLNNVQAGDAGSYSVVVGNGVGSPITSGLAALTVAPAAPVITTQPVAQTVAAGDTVTLTVAAKGTTPFTYQWRRGTTVVGTGQTLVIPSATVLDSGSYSVVVGNGVGSPATSNSVAVLVIAPPSVLEYAGGTYTQDFDTLPSTGTFTFTGAGPFSLDANPGVNAAGLAGWSFGKAAGSGANALFRFDNGGSNSGGAISYGTTNNADRALGSLASGTMASRLGVTLVNTSGHTIQFVTVSYTGEQWRHGGATTPNKLEFSYAVGASDIATGGFGDADDLDFTAPVTTTTTSALDGNLAGNRVTGLTATLTDLNWAPGQKLVLRWTDVDNSGSDDGLAIDDFVLTDAPPVPVITAQPAGQAVTAFEPVTFQVAATSLTPLTYQWRKDGEPITGNPTATTPALQIASATVADAGGYDCMITNAFGPVTSDPAALVVNPVSATVTLGELGYVYSGLPIGTTATTSPTGVPITITYGGGTALPVAAGSYAVVATVADANYTGEATGTLVISPASAGVTLADLLQTYDGTPKAATVVTNPSGVAVTVTYDSGTALPVAAGSYAVVATVTDANYTGGATGTLVIASAAATVTLHELEQVYDGTPKAATATTNPAGLAVTIAYEGRATPPVYPGEYPVVATVTDANYSGSITGILRITAAAQVRHAPSINGGLDASVQVMLPESIVLNGSAWVSGDLLVPGTPSLRLNGSPLFGGTVEGEGSASPAGHSVTLNGRAALLRLITRVDALPWPELPAVPAPAGTRDVALNNSSQPIGDLATLRNLTLNGSGQTRALPAGTYGTLALNGNNVLVLGDAGSATPLVYNLRGLTINGASRVQVVGPVVINLAGNLALNGTMGAAAHPEWLALNLPAGGLALNGDAALHGRVVAPAGTVTIGGSSELAGRVVADRLIINGNGVLTATP